MATLLDFSDRIADKIGTLETTAIGAASSPGDPTARAAIAIAVSGLDSAFGPVLARKVRAHVADHVKARIKMIRSDLPGSNLTSEK